VCIAIDARRRTRNRASIAIDARRSRKSWASIRALLAANALHNTSMDIFTQRMLGFLGFASSPVAEVVREIDRNAHSRRSASIAIDARRSRKSWASIRALLAANALHNTSMDIFTQRMLGFLGFASSPVAEVVREIDRNAHSRRSASIAMDARRSRKSCASVRALLAANALHNTSMGIITQRMPVFVAFTSSRDAD